MCNLRVHWSHTTGKVITSLYTFPSCKLSEDVILRIKLCPKNRTIVMQNVKPRDYTLTGKLIFFIQKRRKYITFHAHKENHVIYFIDSKTIFIIYSLSVFDIPKLCYNLHNSNTEI